MIRASRYCHDRMGNIDLAVESIKPALEILCKKPWEKRPPSLPDRVQPSFITPCARAPA